MDPTRHSKRCKKPMFTSLPDSPHIMLPMTTVSKTDPMIIVSLQMPRAPSQTPSVGSALPRANRARNKVIKRVVSS
jgi:hypothetical protein